MDFEPQKFFIGLVDFFSIIMPGALLTFFLKDDVGPYLLAGYEKLEGSGATAVAVFLFCSYLFSHFIFLIGSWVLDDCIYDPLRTSTIGEQIKRLAGGKKLSPKICRRMARSFFKKNVDHTLTQAVRIKEHYLDQIGASSAINAYQWCKVRLKLTQPEALVMVQRSEADSKFFRSIFIVLCLLLPYELIKTLFFGGNKSLSIPVFGFPVPVILIIGIPMIVFAFFRYLNQRIKSINQAYWFIITIEAQKEIGPSQIKENNTYGCNRAGGVVYRKSGRIIKYLIVQTKKNCEKWVLPKGHIEPGESISETAVREVHEEAGVWASVIREIKDIVFKADNETIKSKFYLMEFLEEGKKNEQREHKWLTLKEITDWNIPGESKELLKYTQEII